jgi:DNA-binding CsgD family transcriptional regulator
LTPRDTELAVFSGRRDFTLAQTQRVLAAVAPLQVHRNRLAVAVGRGATPHTRIAAQGSLEVNRWLLRFVSECRELLSVRPWIRIEELRVSLPRNRSLVEHGTRMTSVYDYRGAAPQARLLLSAEHSADYRFAYAPMQMKIFDRRQVLLDGPAVDDEPSVMLTSEPTCVAAALGYWRAVLESSFRCAEAPERVPDLTDRQRQVIALLSADVSDEQIASALGFSVRTVRAEIARVMTLLGVRSRFSLGQAVNDRLQ